MHLRVVKNWFVGAMGETKAAHLGYLDGWRGGAILLLLAGHFTLIPNVAGHQIYTGRLGVECFFVLSGRLMAEILFVRKIPLDEFYWRRASRILPAMWLFIGTAFIVGQMYPALRIGFSDIAVALSFTANYFIPTDPVAHIWSLCVEEHAYVLLSLIAFLQRRRGLDVKQWLALICATCVLNGALQTWLLHRDYLQVYWRSDVRMASIFMSAALYLYFRNNHAISPVVPLMAVLTGFAISVAPVADPIKYSAGTFLIAFGLATIHCAWAFIRWLLSNPFLRYFGIWSFSFYLWQQPIYLIQAEYPRTALLALLGSIAVGSFYAVERPARRFLNDAFCTRRPSLSPS